MLSSGTLAHVLGRYLSIVLIIVTNVGFFHHGFSPKACDHYFRVGPIFKGTFHCPMLPECERLTSPSVFQAMVSHTILGVRWVLVTPFHTPKSDDVLQGI